MSVPTRSAHRAAARSAVRHLPLPVWTAGAVTQLANSADTFLLFLLLWVAEPQGWSGA